MLGLVFRGVFLIGVLAWYSTTVWKMIDGYFKDQFRSYLEEEYRKNPHMKSDVQSAVHSADNKLQPVQPSRIPEAQVQKMVEACNLENCPVEAVENVGSEGNRPAEREENLEKEKEKEKSLEGAKKMSKEKEVTGSTSENEAEKGYVDKNAFLETASEPGLESRKPRDALQEGKSSGRQNVGEERKSEVSEAGRAASTKRTTGQTAGKRFKGGYSSSKQGKKRKVKTITLTEADFASAKKGNVISEDEFWEFEEDSEERLPPEGILVSELPFKPRLDVGDLERVTGEEYCPLSLDEDPSCGERTEWP